MDNDFRLDLGEIMAAVEKAEVLTIFFPLLGRALLVDLRHDEGEGPFVQSVPMVASVEERVRSLERLRPHFGRPPGIVAVPWFRRVQSLHELGVLAGIVDRFTGAGGSAGACEAAWADLLRAEREHRLAAIKGGEFQTLWRREE